MYYIIYMHVHSSPIGFRRSSSGSHSSKKGSQFLIKCGLGSQTVIDSPRLEELSPTRLELRIQTSLNMTGPMADMFTYM